MSITAFSSQEHPISLEEAVAMTTAFRENNQALLKPEFQDKATLPFSETFNREVFDDLLAQAGCEGIRFYYGLDTDSKVHLVAVGVNADNEDIIAASTAPLPADSLLFENGIRCPTECPPASVLNS